MSMTNTFESDILSLIFNATAIANIADNAGSSPLANLFVSLHTADPGETGNQQTSEATYTSYARVSVVRTSSGWDITGTAPTQAANHAQVAFPQCTGGSNTITYVGIGTLTSGTGKLLYSGALTSSLAVSNGITPSFATGQLIVTQD